MKPHLTTAVCCGLVRCWAHAARPVTNQMTGSSRQAWPILPSWARKWSLRLTTSRPCCRRPQSCREDNSCSSPRKVSRLRPERSIVSRDPGSYFRRPMPPDKLSESQHGSTCQASSERVAWVYALSNEL